MLEQMSNLKLDPQSEVVESDLWKIPKLTTNYTSQTHTENQTVNETYKCSDLSEIILNSENFWHKRAEQSDRNNQNQSLLRQEIRLNEKFSKRNTFQEIQSSLPEQSNIIVETDLQLDSKKSSMNEGLLGIESSEMSSDIQKKSAVENQHCVQQNSSILNQFISHYEGKRQKEISLSEQISFATEKMRDLEQMALLGYWCQLYLQETWIRWEVTCILLYKEVVERMSRFPFLRNKENQMLFQNLSKMLQKIQIQPQCDKVERYLRQFRIDERGETNIFPILFKESQILILDLMKSQASHKMNQFCLFKVLRAVNISAKMNGHLKGELQEKVCLEKDLDFSTENLKNSLGVYKQVQEFLKGMKP